MNANQGGGQGQGRGGRGRKGQSGGRQNSGGSGIAAVDTMCVCPQCGHQEPHQRGFPCINKICSKCGAAMTRQ